MPEEWTFAFVDLAGFTALTEAHGDHEAISTVKAFRERVEALLAPEDLLRVPRQGVQSVMVRWGGDELWFCGLPCVARYATDPAAFTSAGPA